MERNITNRVAEIEEFMHGKVDSIASHIQNGRTECAMIELGALNEYIRLQSNTVMSVLPNNML